MGWRVSRIKPIYAFPSSYSSAGGRATVEWVLRESGVEHWDILRRGYQVLILLPTDYTPEEIVELEPRLYKVIGASVKWRLAVWPQDIDHDMLESLFLLMGLEHVDGYLAFGTAYTPNPDGVSAYEDDGPNPVEDTEEDPDAAPDPPTT